MINDVGSQDDWQMLRQRVCLSVTRIESYFTTILHSICLSIFISFDLYIHSKEILEVKLCLFGLRIPKGNRNTGNITFYYFFLHFHTIIVSLRNGIFLLINLRFP